MKVRKLLQFKQQMKGVHMDATQKNEIKNNLIAFMQEYPVRKNNDARLIQQKPAERLFLFFTQKHMYASIATLLILLTGSGTVFAAENTLPGDPLYGVKVHVNEQVRSALAVSSEAKADWEAKVAERRLDEAARLAAEGRLSAEAEATLEARVEEQAAKIKDRIERLEAEGNTEVAADITARLETALALHGQILDKLESSDEVTKEEIKPLVKQLQAEVVSINALRAKLDSKLATSTTTAAEVKVAAENRMRNSQKHIDDVKEYFDDKDVVATSSAQAKLDLAVKTQADGKAKLEAGEYREAFVLFGTAQRLAHEAKLMAHVDVKLNSDVRLDKIFKDFDDNRGRNDDRRGINLDKDIEVNLENSIRGKFEQNGRDEDKVKVEDRGRGHIELDKVLRVL